MEGGDSSSPCTYTGSPYVCRQTHAQRRERPPCNASVLTLLFIRAAVPPQPM